MIAARLTLCILLLATTWLPEFHAARRGSDLGMQPPNPPKGGQSSMAFTVTSSAFSSGATIPKAYTCQGTDISPTLSWSGHPPQTASFALAMDDPDAPGGTWVHWVMWNLPSSAHLLAENVARHDRLDNGAMQGRNDFRKIGYNGPCPPPGNTHRYFFRLYALDVELILSPGASRQELDTAMKGHILAQAEYVGTFRR
jgi:Raf kinase inhibitor-like YbhB/YbcL family protein